MKHFLNGVQVAPRNIFEFGVTSSFGRDPNILEVDADKVVLPREAREIVENHIISQGVFEGIPYTIQMDNGISLEYYVDLTDGAVFRDFEIELKLKKRGGWDNFWDNAQGTSFELMAYKGVQFNFIDIPYLIIRDNQVELGITLAISLYTMGDALIESIKALSETITNIIDSVTPEVGAGVTLDPAEIATLVVKAIVQIALIALIIVAIIKLAQQMFELLFPKIRYYLGATIRELITKGCQYLGYQLESTLLDSLKNLTIMPVPLTKEKKGICDYIENDLNFSFTKGYPTAQDSTPTLGSLIDTVELMFNARTRVYNGVVRIERRDWWANQSLNQMLPALNLQDDRQSEYTLNTDEAWKRTYIHYLVDYADFHTVDFFDPTDAEYHTDPTNVINADLVTIKGFNDIAIPFALGVRKNELNWIEKIAEGFFKFIDEVANAFGGNSNFASIIQNRIGVTQIGQQFYGQTKLIWAVNGKQPANYVDLMKASTIYNNFHRINEIQNNDYKIFSEVPVRFRPADFVDLLNNNYAEIDGLACEILTIKYNDEQSLATISYKMPYDYANGKVVVLTLND